MSCVRESERGSPPISSSPRRTDPLRPPSRAPAGRPHAIRAPSLFCGGGGRIGLRHGRPSEPRHLCRMTSVTRGRYHRRHMKISGVPYRTIWPLESGAVRVIDQSRLPFELVTLDLTTLEDAARAIKTMVVRG